MAENTTDKEALKAKKEAEKAAEKAKKERIKASKPKKEGTVFSRAGAGIKKYWKDFTGTCKKIIWPTGKQVLKNSGVTLVSILIIGLVVFAFDWGLEHVFDLAEQGVESLAGISSEVEDESAEDESTEGSEESTTEVAEETSADDAEETTAETAEETTAEDAEETTAE